MCSSTWKITRKKDGIKETERGGEKCPLTLTDPDPDRTPDPEVETLQDLRGSVKNPAARYRSLVPSSSILPDCKLAADRNSVIGATSCPSSRATMSFHVILTRRSVSRWALLLRRRARTFRPIVLWCVSLLPESIPNPDTKTWEQ